MKYHLIYSIFLSFSSLAYANRLEDAAHRGTEVILSVGQVSSVAGIALGATLMAFGASGAGRNILMGGVFGAIAIFGGPAFIDVIRGIFQ